jgi:cbb3-type cytochrome oxidase maturation protein
VRKEIGHDKRAVRNSQHVVCLDPEGAPMTALAWLIPCALLLGLLGLAAFLWSLNTGQFEDLEGAGWRALQDEEGPPGPTPQRRPLEKSAPAVR